MSDTDPPEFDLAKLIQPVRVEVPHVGAIALDLQTSAFLSWLDNGEKAGRWHNPHQFVRNLLTERLIADESQADPKGKAGKQLSADELDTVALAILDQARATGKLRITDLAAEETTRPDSTETTSGSAQLLAAARDYLAHHREMNRRAMETLKRAGGIEEIIAKTTALSSILKSPQLPSAGLLGSAEFAKALDLGSILKSQNLVTQSLLGSDMARRSMLAFDDKLSILKATQGLASASLFAEHQRLAAQLAQQNSPLEQLRRATQGIVGLSAWRTIEARERLFADRVQWAQAVNSQLRLALPATLFASLAAAQLGQGLGVEAAARDIASMVRPGFQATANVALEGLAPMGPVAELLRRYDETVDAPAMSAVHGTVRLFDAENAGIEAFMDAFDRAWEMVVEALRLSPDLLRNSAFIAWLGTLAAIAGAGLVAYQVFGPPPASVTQRMDQSNRELHHINDQLAAQRQSDEARKHIRYVLDVVNLRTEPNRRAQVVRLVYPDQPVRVIETKGEWAKVEVFDYGSDRSVLGWISRRHLHGGPSG